MSGLDRSSLPSMQKQDYMKCGFLGEKLYDDLHVRLRDTVILMCSIFYKFYRSKYEFNSCHYWSHADFLYDTLIIGLGFGLAIFDSV